MLRNYFKTALRYFYKQTTFSLINIIGLSTGICVCFFALIYVQFELSRDTYNKQADHIYRLVTDIKTPAGIDYESTPAPMSAAMLSSFPGIKEAARVFMDDMIVQSNPDNAIKEEIAYADASVFKIFTWPVLRGDQRHLFDNAYNVVLTQTAANKYFGAEDPIGKTLLVNGKEKATVTGVMKDIPYNAHLRVSMLFSMSTLVNEDWNHNWTRFGFYTYLLLSPTANAGNLQAKLPAFVNANFEQSKVKYQLSLEPLKSVYLYGKPRGHRTGASASGSITNVYVCSIIAILVLFIACFNFINLNTVFSLQRAKEIGVRKVLGASKKQLAIQFFAGTFFLCGIAFVIALVLASLFLPVFNQLTGTIISTGIFGHLQNLAFLLLITVFVGLLSGAYPAFVLSSFNPVGTLKGKFEASGSGLLLRKVLIVVQFSISICLIIGTAVIYRQINFMQNQDLGFQKSHKLIIDFQFDSRINQHAAEVKQQLLAIPGVNDVSMSSGTPGSPNSQFNTTIQNAGNENQELRSDAYFIDDAFLNQYKVNLAAGRNFSTQNSADDGQAMLINETMAKNLGFSNAADAIGKRFTQLNTHGTITGVVKDFHFHSSLERIQPLTLRMSPGFFTDISIDISSANLSAAINNIHQVWKNVAPGLPFVYFFADEAYNQQYIAQEHFEHIFITFAVIAIVISCLGLLGLSAFNTIQRKKEMGIRKVMGASAFNIVATLSKDFVKLIIIALLIASPISWWVMHHWLQTFAYRISIPIWIFLLSGFAALIIAMVTISFQSIKAALVNPVKSLKTH